jgi:hypothetical protein
MPLFSRSSTFKRDHVKVDKHVPAHTSSTLPAKIPISASSSSRHKGNTTTGFVVLGRHRSNTNETLRVGEFGTVPGSSRYVVSDEKHAC